MVHRLSRTDPVSSIYLTLMASNPARADPTGTPFRVDESLTLPVARHDSPWRHVRGPRALCRRGLLSLLPLQLYSYVYREEVAAVTKAEAHHCGTARAGA